MNDVQQNWSDLVLEVCIYPKEMGMKWSFWGFWILQGQPLPWLLAELHGGIPPISGQKKEENQLPKAKQRDKILLRNLKKKTTKKK